MARSVLKPPTKEVGIFDRKQQIELFECAAIWQFGRVIKAIVEMLYKANRFELFGSKLHQFRHYRAFRCLEIRRPFVRSNRRKSNKVRGIANAPQRTKVTRKGTARQNKN